MMVEKEDEDMFNIKSLTIYSECKYRRNLNVGTYTLGLPGDRFLAAMGICQKNGLFMVPVGELEYFYRPLASNSTHGTKWVNGVMEKDLANDRNMEEARKFVKEIDEY